MEGHTVEWDVVMGSIHPVHEREDGNAAHKEGEQYHPSIGLVEPAVLETQLVGEEKRKRMERGHRQREPVTLKL